MALQSFTKHMMKLWDGWEIRVLVLLSLFVQIILIIFGSQRKFTRRIWINLLVWLAYLTADMVATVALGCLARSRGDSPTDEALKVLKLQAFWAPFLLLHLGGPDTITAYSLNDNELWLRHFLHFGFQTGVAFYVFIPSWKNKDAFRFIAIPVFIAGIIKYGERILVLYSSSSKQFKDSLRSLPEFDEDPSNLEEKKRRVEKKPTEEVKNYLIEAVSLFKKFRCLYADLILDHDERKESYSLLLNKASAKEAFKLVATELGFMYDVLYTKTITIYSVIGIIFRCICLFSHIFVSVIFLMILDKSSYSPSDVSITYLLLVGAIFLEVYAFIVLLFSDWTKYWLTKHNYVSIKTCSKGLLSNDNRRWSGSMGQYNLLSFSLSTHKSATLLILVQKLFRINELIEKYKYLTWKEVDDGLLEVIFKQLLEKSQEIEGDHFDIKQCKELLSKRGDYVLSKVSFSNEVLNKFRWSITEVEFDYSLLLWHIATDICYYDNPEGQEIPPKGNISKCLSDYMLYLLVICPTMLPKGIGEIRYKDTCLEAIRFLRKKEFRSSTEISTVCKALLDESARDPNIMNKGSSLSVLVHGCKLAKQLQDLKHCSGTNHKWEMISEVWMEMLGYAANHCGWKEHGEQLMNGGELLTHICLLMAHLGLSEQYQIYRQTIHRHWAIKLFGGLQSGIFTTFTVIFEILSNIMRCMGYKLVVVLGFIWSRPTRNYFDPYEEEERERNRFRFFSCYRRRTYHHYAN